MHPHFDLTHNFFLSGYFLSTMLPSGETYHETGEYNRICSSYESARDFILEYVYPLGRICTIHDCQCELVYSASRTTFWKCPIGRHSVGLLEGSFLHKSRVGLHKVLMILLHFWLGISRQKSSYLTGVERHTVSFYYSLGEATLNSFICDHFDIKLGGPGKIVQIDECCLRRRKYKKGRGKKLIWLFGAVELCETGSQGDFIITRVMNRSAAILIPLIKTLILPGTEIWSDEWAAYGALGANGYIHKTVSHKHRFKDPSGTHTNVIEGLWSQFRRALPSTGLHERFINQFVGQFMGKKQLDCRFPDFIRLVTMYKIENQHAEEGEEDIQTVEADDILGEYVSSESDDDPLGLTEGITEEEWSPSVN